MAEISKRNRTEETNSALNRDKFEIAKQAVFTYLSSRNYSDSEIQKKNVPCEQLLLSNLIEKESSKPNSILYSAASYKNTFSNDPNPIQVDPYFYKFISWINTLSSCIKAYLSKVVCPLFCHLYLDLLNNSHPQSANILLKYYQEHCRFTTENEICNQVLREIPCLDYKTKAIIRTFRSTKCKIKLSSEALDLLRAYLAKNAHILILQVFQTWFDVEIVMGNSAESEDENENISQNGDACEEDFDNEVQELQHAICSLNQQTSPVLLVNIYNSQLTATCGMVNDIEEKVVAGFTTSEIYLWSTGSKLLPCDGIEGNISKISLACDNIPENTVNPYKGNSLTCTGAAILRGHGESVQDVKIISEANVLLSVSQDKTMRAWRFSDYSCAAIYRGHNYAIWCVDVSAFGMHIATGSYDKTVRLWSLDRIYPTRILSGHTKDVNCVNFHPNGMYLASGSSDKSIRLWSTSESKTVRLLVGHTGMVYTVAFSPNGQYIASGGDDKTVCIWDVTAAKQLCEIKSCTNVVTDLSWSKDGRHLAANCLDGCVRVWDADSVIKKYCDPNNVDVRSVYQTGRSSLLHVNYDKNWLTCLVASSCFEKV